MGQIGFFEFSKRYTGLDAKNEPLAKIDEVIPWGIDAPIDRQVLSMSAKGFSSVQGEEKVREEGGRVLGRRSA